MQVLVTVGIPAYSRPEGLRRALQSLAAQHSRNFRVIVLDDCSPQSLEPIVDEFRDSIPRLEYIRRDRNVGLVANNLSLLQWATTPYFMWLADDDEVSPSYIGDLVAELEAHPGAATAFGRWYLASAGNPMDTEIVPTVFPEQDVVARCHRYVRRCDDAFFYGLHRSSVLKQASFSGYLWPNASEVQNWCYVWDFDLVLRGQVVQSQSPDAYWIDHDYTPKLYVRRIEGLGNELRAELRRLNIRALYVKKALPILGLRQTVVMGTVSADAFLRELWQRWGHRRVSLPPRWGLGERLRSLR